MNHRFCVAPMLDCTDRHQRYLFRLISKKASLYTEMVTTGAVLHGDRERLLAFDSLEHPVAFQLGGSEPEAMARSALLAEQAGYGEININAGCPSDRVQAGQFGVALMLEPARLVECHRAMSEVLSIPVTLKHRVGVDDQDSKAFLTSFVTKMAEGGCRTFIIHARKAWRHGLSPKQNRQIPPLCYHRVYQLKQDFPELEVVINGGITSLDEALGHLDHVDGVMVGRAIYNDPYRFSAVDQRLFGAEAYQLTRQQLLEAYLPYLRSQLEQGTPLGVMARHLFGLFHGVPGARGWRRTLGEGAWKPDAGVEVIERARALVPASA